MAVRGGGNHVAVVPQRIAERFGISATPSRDEHPTVDAVRYGAAGWTPVAGHKRVAGSFLRSERKKGADAVRVRLGSRVVEFEMKGLVN